MLRLRRKPVLRVVFLGTRLSLRSNVGGRDITLRGALVWLGLFPRVQGLLQRFRLGTQGFLELLQKPRGGFCSRLRMSGRKGAVFMVAIIYRNARLYL